MAQQKGLGALQFARVPLRRPDFKNNTSQFVRIPPRKPNFEDEPKKSKSESKVKKEVEALIPNLPKTEELDYPGTDVPYKYRGLADVEFRADIDPIISGVPPALLKYQDIEQKTGGDVGELIKVILGEDDPNNPGLFSDSRNTLGRYIPAEDERYYKKDNLGEPGVSYAFEPDTSEFDSNRLIETLVEELGHGGMRILEKEGYDPIVGVSKRSELPFEEELMDQYQYRTREDTPEISIETIGGGTNAPPTLEKAEVFCVIFKTNEEQSL